MPTHAEPGGYCPEESKTPRTGLAPRGEERTGSSPQEDVKDGQGAGHVPFDCLPNLHVSCVRSMRLFNPAVDLADPSEADGGGAAAAPLTAQTYPFADGSESSLPDHGFEPVDTTGLGRLGVAPLLPLPRAVKANPGVILIPREEDCYALWDKYRMPKHIRRHSQRVADMAAGVAHLAAEQGFAVPPEAVYAAGLLHDLAKAYCIAHGGNHAEVGAAWVMRETRNAPIAQGVLFHVHWPWEETVDDGALLVLALLYADKRVMHDGYVTLEARYTDLFERYGVTETSRALLATARDQGKRVEAALSGRLGVNLNEYTAYRGRLVR